MGQITSREELEEWLKDKPADWGRVLSARAALRVLPYALGSALDDRLGPHSMGLIRAVMMAWVGRNLPELRVVGSAAAKLAADQAEKTKAILHDRAVMLSTHAEVVFPIQSATRASSDAWSAAARTGSSSANVIAGSAFDAFNPEAGGGLYFYFYLDNLAGYVAKAAAYDPETYNPNIDNNELKHALEASLVAHIWANIDDDCRLLSVVSERSASQFLTQQSLWPEQEPGGWNVAWSSSANGLHTLDPTYQVWIDWYNRRIEGRDAAFDIPGDKDRTEDKKILARLADATDEDFWRKGATYVNTTLQSWIDEARERVRPSETPDEPPPPTPDAIRAVAAEIASPNVTLTDNKLDVTTNTAFDGQTDTANLDEAIAVLRAVVGALLGGLPGNAPRSFAANLTIYDGELAKRDAKPFLGVLVRMEKSVSAGFHADPEMFDAGVITNFESYFDAHLAFMTHYRRNEEREAKIAQFSIDDAAASGVALTGPVDEVVKEVDALAEQGLVTDGFVQAIKEQQAINYEVALYTSPASAKSGEPTVKERHILQTVGFYERTLAIAANTIAVTTQFAAFIIVLKTAIEALLKFFI